MKFEIPFDEKIFKEQIALNFDEAWKPHLIKNRKNIYSCIVMILIGSGLIYFKGYVGSIFLVLGLFYFLHGLHYYFNYKKKKKKQAHIANLEAQSQINANENSIWEFNDEYFRYKDYKGDFKLKWFAFQGYRIIDNTLFLDVYSDNLMSYIINKEEIGAEEFNTVIALVKKKISNLP